MKNYKTTFIGACLVIITIAFSAKWITLEEFVSVFGLFSGAGFWMAMDSRSKQKDNSPSGPTE